MQLFNSLNSHKLKNKNEKKKNLSSPLLFGSQSCLHQFHLIAMSKSPKLKPLPRPLFSCGIFRNCTQSVLSPTAPPSSASLLPPPVPPPPPPPPPTSDQLPPPPLSSSSSSSSSSSTSPSFTQWRFPLHHPQTHSESGGLQINVTQAPAASSVDGDGGGHVFGAAEAQFGSGSPLSALRIVEKSLASGSGSGSPVCSRGVMAGVVQALRDPASARPAAKVLLALLLVEPNRRVAVEAGAVAAAVEAVVATNSTSTSTAERALAALELMCTVEEGASEVRTHALAAPAMGGAIENMQGRGRECAIGVLAAVYGGSGDLAKDAPEEVIRAVMMAMQGECSARGRRKGGVLLRALQECGRLDSDLNFDG